MPAGNAEATNAEYRFPKGVSVARFGNLRNRLWYSTSHPTTAFQADLHPVWVISVEVATNLSLESFLDSGHFVLFLVHVFSAEVRILYVSSCFQFEINSVLNTRCAVDSYLRLILAHHELINSRAAPVGSADVDLPLYSGSSFPVPPFSGRH